MKWRRHVAIKDRTYEDILASAVRVAEKKRIAWQEAFAKKNATILKSNLDHSSPPDNYWQDEHRRHSELVFALAIVSALQELS